MADAKGSCADAAPPRAMMWLPGRPGCKARKNSVMAATSDAGVWRSKARQRILLAAALVVLIGAILWGWRVWSSAGPDTRIASDRVFVCVDCGRVFWHTLTLGEAEPLTCRGCGKKTAWMAEACYWTKDGKAKLEPTYVILKQRMGIDEKTYCPDCGREVVGHNPRPPKELMDEAQAAADR